MARPKAKYERSCTVCISTLPRRGKPGKHYADGKCEKHYRKDQRKKPQCKADGCSARLDRGHSRQGYCRWHEPLLLKEPIRSPDAIFRTLEKFRSEITPTQEGLDGLFGCWPWTGRRNKLKPGPDGRPRPGYGLITISNPEWLAHRFSYGYFVGGHRPRLTVDHVCRNSLCVRVDHLMPMTQRRNSELEHKRAIDNPEAVFRDLSMLPRMQPGAMAWAMLKGLPVGRATAGGDPFNYGLDGEAFQHELGPASFPPVSRLFRSARGKPQSPENGPEQPPLLTLTGKQPGRHCNPFAARGAVTTGGALGRVRGLPPPSRP